MATCNISKLDHCDEDIGRTYFLTNRTAQRIYYHASFHFEYFGFALLFECGLVLLDFGSPQSLGTLWLVLVETMLRCLAFKIFGIFLDMTSRIVIG